MNLRYSSLVLALSSSTAVLATPSLVDEDTWRFLEGNITDADDGEMVMADGGGCYDMTVHQCGCGPDECNAALCSSLGRIWTAECPTHCTDCDGSMPMETATNGDHDYPDDDDALRGDDDDDEMAHSSHDHGSHDHASHDEGEMDVSTMESSAISFASAAMATSALVGSVLALV